MATNPIIEATRLWEQRVEEFARSHKDNEYGSCVIGAGIESKRISPVKFRIPAPSRYQGSITWEHDVDEIIAFLTARGLPCFYDCGSID